MRISSIYPPLYPCLHTPLWKPLDEVVGNVMDRSISEIQNKMLMKEQTKILNLAEGLIVGDIAQRQAARQMGLLGSYVDMYA